MKLTIKTTAYVLFSSIFLFAQETGKNYAVFNSLIRHTDIENFYTINELRRVFENPEVQELEEVLSRFKRKPEKTKNYKEYRTIFLNEKRVNDGVRFFFENKDLFKKIIQDFKIDPLIIVAIVGVETNYGEIHAEYSVFNSLYTQALNLPQRKVWATKELFELLVYCKEAGEDPFEVRGSYAGAFGYGQFIPSSFRRLSIDYNQNGKKEPYNWEDVLGSIAHYLKENKYPDDYNNFSFRSKSWQAIRTYNRSDHYANTIIELRNELAKQVFLSF
jgi:membrane-bound lytic murein transglycosylase B